MKPSNWRKFYGYRPSRSLNWKPYRVSQTAEHDYLNWLRAKYGFATRAEAMEHVNRTQRPCGLIGAHHFAGEPSVLAPKPPAIPQLPRILTAVRLLPWKAVEA